MGEFGRFPCCFAKCCQKRFLELQFALEGKMAGLLFDYGQGPMAMDKARFLREAADFVENNANWTFNGKTLTRELIKDSLNVYLEVLYHPSYLVPVLYFIPMKITIEEGLETSSLASIEHLSDLLVTLDNQVISFGENPANGQVMYFIHPCRTCDFMQEVMETCGGDTNYLASWLSFVQKIFKVSIN